MEFEFKYPRGHRKAVHVGEDRWEVHDSLGNVKFSHRPRSIIESFYKITLPELEVPDPAITATTLEGEGGEVRVISATGGEKGSKPARFDLIPSGPLWEVAELYGAGAAKYADRNWEKGYDWSLSFAALQRHAQLFWQGEDKDSETGKHHMASVVFHAMALMEFARTHPEYDNRP